MLPIARYTLLLAIRSRLFIVLLSVALALIGVAWLASHFSPRQPQTVMLDVGLSFIRFVLPLLGILLVQEFVMREIDRKLLLTALTYPRSRADYLLGRFSGMAIVLLGVLVLLAALLAAAVQAIAGGYAQSTPISLGWPYVVTVALIWLDALVVLAFALLLAAVATTPNLVLLGSAGFVLIARSIGSVLQILREDATVVAGGHWYQSGLGWARYLVPDLGLLDVRMIALYDRFAMVTAPWPALLLTPIAYTALLLALAVWRFNRRQFG